ncbi:protein-tyrosine phosphatase/arsenate reductase [Filimonas lacunae]|uniref:Protein-tyrosine phosphatase/arsenate reductase n=2 Tax=Filimonas lacunae TaxID=477680 RepID=A0A1N7NF72_9BACT|nr:protein-tyrosine phosphatase/arsenate reductase [Filimonas lacunae]
MQLYPAIVAYIQTAEKGIAAIPAERKTQLDSITTYVKQKINKGQIANLIFICTHNSRRSHTAQLWAAAAAAYYGVDGVANYSGGTEITAFNLSAIKALTDAGFSIEVATPGKNPVFEVKLGNNLPAIPAFSKKYMDEPNPAKDFAAVMTCSHADESCPFVAGADGRIAIPYEDPKAFDGTPRQDAAYKERCLQIATEMLYVFGQLKKN